MSALDDLIANDAKGVAPSGLDAVIAQDSAPAPGTQAARDVQNQAMMNQTSSNFGNLMKGGAKAIEDLVQAPAQGMFNGASWLYDKTLSPGEQRGSAGNFLLNHANRLNADLAKQETDYQAATPGSGAAAIGRVAGGIAPFLGSGGASAAPEAIGMLPKIGRAAEGLWNTASKGVGFGMSQPVTDATQNPDGTNDFMSQKGMQGAVGAPLALAGRGIGGMIAKAVSPQVAPGVAGLMKEGVTPTIGQILGGGYAATENKLTSVPVIGDLIRNAQRRSVEGFNSAAYNRALNPIGQSADSLGLQPGREGVEGVRNALSTAYDSVLPKLSFKVDGQFVNDFNQLKTLASNLPAPQAAQFNKILQNTFMSKLGPQGTMDGIALKGVESDLGSLSKGYSKDSLYDNQQLGDALRQAQDNIRSNLTRNNPQYADALQKINQGYANFAIIRKAASGLGAGEGVFTPAQLQSAVKASDMSVGKGRFATGNALMQDLSEPGKGVMTSYPDSGTAGRNMVGALAAGSGPIVGGMMTHPFATTLATGGTLGATLLGSAPYTGLGQKAAAAILTKRPAIAAGLASGIRSASPFAGLSVTPSLLEYLNQTAN